MTSMPPREVEGSFRRVAILGTGLMGTSIAMAATRAGSAVVGWDRDPDVLARAATTGALAARWVWFVVPHAAASAADDRTNTARAVFIA